MDALSRRDKAGQVNRKDYEHPSAEYVKLKLASLEDEKKRMQ
jgi:hypothetical protein